MQVPPQSPCSVCFKCIEMNPICVYHDVLKLNVKTPVNEKVILISNTSLSRDPFSIPVIRIYAPPFVRPPKTPSRGITSKYAKKTL